MSTTAFILYCMTIFTASIIPGPSMLLALTQGSRFGWAAGAMSALGNVIASLVQGIVALLIVVEIGQLSSTVLWALKIAGAAYIVYMGITLLSLQGFGEPPGEDTAPPAGNLTAHLWNGFAFAIFNPKALTFFAALFPQFVSSEPISTPALATIFLPIAVIAFGCFMLYVTAGKLLMRLLGATQHIGKILGGSIILAGAGLLLT